MKLKTSPPIAEFCFLVMQHKSEPDMMSGYGLPLLLVYANKDIAHEFILGLHPSGTHILSSNKSKRTFYKVVSSVFYWYSIFTIQLENPPSIEQTH